MTQVSVIDIGIGNFRAVDNMLGSAGISSTIVTSPKEAIGSTHLFLPGVGSFDAAMGRLEKTGWSEEIKSFAAENRGTVVGICLGAQLLGNGSEEGILPGLGLLDFEVVRLRPSGLPLPHMGWNSVSVASGLPSFEEVFSESRFYFAHSYCIPVTENLTAGISAYGQEFSSVVAAPNILGFQFHPEKSHSFGKRLLKRVADAV